eukprot:11603850-Ditylum_brightwellii.AAC.1
MGLYSLFSIVIMISAQTEDALIGKRLTMIAQWEAVVVVTSFCISVIDVAVAIGTCVDIVFNVYTSSPQEGQRNTPLFSSDRWEWKKQCVIHFNRQCPEIIGDGFTVSGAR